MQSVNAIAMISWYLNVIVMFPLIMKAFAMIPWSTNGIRTFCKSWKHLQWYQNPPIELQWYCNVQKRLQCFYQSQKWLQWYCNQQSHNVSINCDSNCDDTACCKTICKGISNSDSNYDDSAGCKSTCNDTMCCKNNCDGTMSQARQLQSTLLWVTRAIAMNLQVVQGDRKVCLNKLQKQLWWTPQHCKCNHAVDSTNHYGFRNRTLKVVFATYDASHWSDCKKKLAIVTTTTIAKRMSTAIFLVDIIQVWQALDNQFILDFHKLKARLSQPIIFIYQVGKEWCCGSTQ